MRDGESKKGGAVPVLREGGRYVSYQLQCPFRFNGKAEAKQEAGCLEEKCAWWRNHFGKSEEGRTFPCPISEVASALVLLFRKVDFLAEVAKHKP